jgi:hypothetical protein
LRVWLPVGRVLSESLNVRNKIRLLVDLRYGRLASDAHDNCGGDQHAQVANCFEVHFSLLSLGIVVDALDLNWRGEGIFPRSERFCGEGKQLAITSGVIL